MDLKWHIAFCNVTYTEYAKVSYADYYGSPAVMLETQLAAREYAEQRFGVGRFMHPHVDMPSCDFASFLGMSVITPEEDEIPYLDTAHPLLTEFSNVDSIRIGNPKTDGLMAKRYEAWEYYKAHGHNVGFGGYGGAVINAACEITGGAILAGLLEDPEGAERVLDKIVQTEETLARFDCSLRGAEYRGFTYTGDDFSGLLSPSLYRRFAVPRYLKLYGDNKSRFMHSELLRAEHLRIARDEVGITDFHGAGCKNLSLEEMHDIMGEAFWTQLTPQEMLELTPAQIADRVARLAQSGGHRVQLYPGRGTPERNMEASIAAAEKECPGGPAW